MPWFSRPTEYICDDCGTHYRNAVAGPAHVSGGYASSPVSFHGPGGAVTRCADCMVPRNRHFQSDVTNLGTKLGTTITYRIHGGGNFTFLGAATLMANMVGDTASAMFSSGALNLMEHPAYAGGMIRSPGAFSGPNLGHNAMAAWPGGAGMGQHHVHVGRGGQTRVLFGWAVQAYPAPNALWVQSITLYIGS